MQLSEFEDRYLWLSQDIVYPHVLDQFFRIVKSFTFSVTQFNSTNYTNPYSVGILLQSSPWKGSHHRIWGFEVLWNLGGGGDALTACILCKVAKTEPFKYHRHPCNLLSSGWYHTCGHWSHRWSSHVVHQNAERIDLRWGLAGHYEMHMWPGTPHVKRLPLIHWSSEPQMRVAASKLSSIPSMPTGLWNSSWLFSVFYVFFKALRHW